MSMLTLPIVDTKMVDHVPDENGQSGIKRITTLDHDYFQVANVQISRFSDAQKSSV